MCEYLRHRRRNREGGGAGGWGARRGLPPSTFLKKYNHNLNHYPFFGLSRFSISLAAPPPLSIYFRRRCVISFIIVSSDDAVSYDIQYKLH